MGRKKKEPTKVARIPEEFFFKADPTPKQVARELMKENFPISQYENIQQSRVNRLKKFKEIGIPVLISEAEKLISFGEEVLKILHKHLKK